MKGILGYILIAASAMLTTIACNKSLSDKQPKHGLILLNAVEEGALNKGTFSATKALLDSNTFMTEGNQIVVYDYYTAPEGVQNPNPATGYYIPGVTAQSTGVTDAGTVWPFLDDARYEWTDAGTHKFFGWMVKDNNENPELTASGFFGEDFEFDDKEHILKIPTTTLSQGGAQFDFMYSNIHTREPAVDGFDAVPLQFSHLFTAFTVSADNQSTNTTIRLKSVTIEGLKNKRSATINYGVDGPDPQIAYDDKESVGSFTFDGPEADLTSTNVLLSDEYFLMWPHEENDFEDVTIKVKYVATENTGSGYSEETDLDVEVSKVSWLAGKKYNLRLQFFDKKIIVNCEVADWIPVEEVLDFNDQVSVRKPLTWIPGTYDRLNIQEGMVLLFNEESIVAECAFDISTPVGATWTASLIAKTGNVDAFSFVEGTKYGVVGVEDTIKIKVNKQVPITPLNECILRITVQTIDGRSIKVRTLMPDGTPQDIEEFIIAQNPNN